MVAISRLQLNRYDNSYATFGSRAVQNLQQIIQSNQEFQTVRFDNRSGMSSRFWDSLTRIQELVLNGANSSGIIKLNVNTDMAKSEFFKGTAKDSDSTKYVGFEGVPSGSFQILTAPELSDNQLKDLVRSTAKIEGISRGDAALYKALQDGTAKIYNQKDSQNLLGKPVDWKQGSIGGTMWDRSAIDQKAVQQITDAGKKIFAGAIGSIHFAIVY